MHNLLCDNCHHHVGACLGEMAYKGRTRWSAWAVWWELLSGGRFVSPGRALATLLPFLIILTLALSLSLSLHPGQA